jgi:hypothetical protein
MLEETIFPSPNRLEATSDKARRGEICGDEKWNEKKQLRRLLFLLKQAQQWRQVRNEQNKQEREARAKHVHQI